MILTTLLIYLTRDIYRTNKEYKVLLLLIVLNLFFRHSSHLFLSFYLLAVNIIFITKKQKSKAKNINLLVLLGFIIFILIAFNVTPERFIHEIKNSPKNQLDLLNPIESGTLYIKSFISSIIRNKFNFLKVFPNIAAIILFGLLLIENIIKKRDLFETKITLASILFFFILIISENHSYKYYICMYIIFFKLIFNKIRRICKENIPLISIVIALIFILNIFLLIYNYDHEIIRYTDEDLYFRKDLEKLQEYSNISILGNQMYYFKLNNIDLK